MSFTRRSELANNSIGGTLPPTYGSNGSFPVIGAMQVGAGLCFTKTLPCGYVHFGATNVSCPWPPMHLMCNCPCRYLDNNQLSGSHPAEWGSPDAFQQLNVM